MSRADSYVNRCANRVIVARRHHVTERVRAICGHIELTGLHVLLRGAAPGCRVSLISAALVVATLVLHADIGLDEAISAAATTIMASCASDSFVVSFGAATPAFPLPDGRSRLYLSDVSAQEVAARASQATFENPEARLVFLSDTNDTRFDSYSVLRPLSVSEGLEAQKADMENK